jgi:hypothetical protein
MDPRPDHGLPDAPPPLQPDHGLPGHPDQGLPGRGPRPDHELPETPDGEETPEPKRGEGEVGVRDVEPDQDLPPQRFIPGFPGERPLPPKPTTGEPPVEETGEGAPESKTDPETGEPYPDQGLPETGEGEKPGRPDHGLPGEPGHELPGGRPGRPDQGLPETPDPKRKPKK